MITIQEFRDNYLVAQAFTNVSDLAILSTQETVRCLIDLNCIREDCRITVWSLAIAHFLTLSDPSCGLPLNGVTEVKNEADQVKFSPRSINELESTQWGFMLREALRQCRCGSGGGFYYTDDYVPNYGCGC